MSLRIAIVLAVLGAPQLAAAERAIAVDVVGSIIEARDIEAALRVRLAADGAPVHVRVIETPDGVRIEAAIGARDVALGGLRGAAAARLVALALGDLLLDDLSTAPALPAASTAPGNGAPAPGNVAPRPRPVEPAALALLGAVSVWDGALGNVALDLTLPRRGWLLAIDVGGGQLLDSALNLTAAFVRLDAGVRRGVLELRVGIIAAPVIVTGGTGDQTVLLGANTSARLRLPVAPSTHVIAAGGIDAFATTTEYQMAGKTTMTTPQLAPWLAAGVEVGL